MRTIRDWLKYVEESKRPAREGERPAPSAIRPPAQPPVPPRPPVSEHPTPARKETPTTPERQVPPPVKVRKGEQSLPSSVRPIGAEPSEPKRKGSKPQSPERMKQLMASIDSALQTSLPLPTPPRESAARRRKRSPFSEARESLIRRLVDPELKLREVALLLNVCPTTVRRYANRGSLTSHRTGGNQRRFRLSDVVDFLHTRRTGQRRSEQSPPSDSALTFPPDLSG
jgi:excisionase family DNA binding protein